MDVTAKRAFKNDLYDQIARIGRAVANGRRLELLDVLAQGERPVESLARETGQTLANASQHLQVLRAAGLVETRREGLQIFYRLAGDDVASLLLSLRSVAEERLAEIERLVADFFTARANDEPIEADELERRLAAGEVLLLDVRPVQEYAQGHIAGAISVPVDDLERRLATLPSGGAVVAYCRGPYCVYADEAVAALRSRGRTAHRLAVGWPEWRQAGRAVAVGAG